MKPVFRNFVSWRLALAVSVCAAGVVHAPALIAAPDAQPASGEVAQAAAALRAISTLRADFTQTDANGGRVAGVLTLKNPGKIRFSYAPGYPMVIVSDGRALTMLDTELHQMQRWPIANSPLGALLDPSRDVTRYGTVIVGFDPHILLVEVRDRKHPEYGQLVLSFEHKAAAPGGLELTGWTAFDAQSRRTVIRLANHRYGVPLDEAQFRLLNPAARPHH
jgi:outer membrane lipoprotein-sorting protein